MKLFLLSSSIIAFLSFNADATGCSRFIHLIGSDPLAEIAILTSVEAELRGEEAVGKLSEEQSAAVVAFERIEDSRVSTWYRRKVSGLKALIEMEKRVRKAHLVLARFPQLVGDGSQARLEALRTVKRVLTTADDEKITEDVLRNLLAYSRTFHLLQVVKIKLDRMTSKRESLKDHVATLEGRVRDLELAKSDEWMRQQYDLSEEQIPAAIVTLIDAIRDLKVEFAKEEVRIADTLIPLETRKVELSDALNAIFEELPAGLFKDESRIAYAVATEDRVRGCCRSSCWHCPLNRNAYFLNYEAFFEGGLGVTVSGSTKPESTAAKPDLALYRARERLKAILPYVEGASSAF